MKNYEATSKKLLKHGGELAHVVEDLSADVKKAQEKARGVNTVYV